MKVHAWFLSYSEPPSPLCGGLPVVHRRYLVFESILLSKWWWQALVCTEPVHVADVEAYLRTYGTDHRISYLGYKGMVSSRKSD